MNLTYNLPKDFKEDEAVVSLLEAGRYAKSLQQDLIEFYEPLLDALQYFLYDTYHTEKDVSTLRNACQDIMNNS